MIKLNTKTRTAKTKNKKKEYSKIEKEPLAEAVLGAGSGRESTAETKVASAGRGCRWGGAEEEVVRLLLLLLLLFCGEQHGVAFSCAVAIAKG